MSPPELRALLAEIDERNQDNVSRTESYLTLYAYTRAHPPDLPWLLMAHLVSRHAGYLMTDLARATSGPRGAYPFTPEAMRGMFFFLERANFLIFHDAWHHVLHHLLGLTHELREERTPAFVREAYRRYERAREEGVTAATERALVMDLVTNEQNFIERRVVHHARFAAPLAIISFFESVGRASPLALPLTDASIVVPRFADLSARIAVGARIFDEVLADRGLRDAIFAWALEHPHTGCRSVIGEPPSGALRDGWPLARVRALSPEIHAPPEPDPLYP